MNAMTEIKKKLKGSKQPKSDPRKLSSNSRDSQGSNLKYYNSKLHIKTESLYYIETEKRKNTQQNECPFK